MSYLLHISRNPIVRTAYKGFNPPVQPFFVHPEPRYEDINLSLNSKNSLLSFPVGLYRKYERNISKTKIIRIFISKENLATLSSTKRFFEIISGVKEPVFFEILTDDNKLVWQIAAQEKDVNLIKNALKSTNPNSVIMDIEDDPIQDHYDQIKYSEEKKYYEFNFFSFSPNSTFIRRHNELKDSEFNNSSFLYLLCNLFQEFSQNGNFTAYQLSVWPCRNDWGRLAAQLIKLSKSSAASQDLHPNILKLFSPMSGLNTKEFLIAKLYSVHMRIITLCKKGESLNFIQNFLQLLKSTGTGFIQYNKDYYLANLPDPYLARDMIFKKNYLNEGFLIPLNELMRFFHFPTEKMISDKMLNIVCISNSSPSEKYKNDTGTIIGYTEEFNEKSIISISPTLKRHHTYIIGSTGSGKSVMLQNMIKSDIDNGQGLCVIDPHGDLARAVIGLIPENRINDVIYLNPSDEEYAPCFNILNLRLEKYEACNCLMDVFQNIFTDFSYRQLEIIRFCLLALLEKKGMTIKNILDILLNRMYREHLIIKITDPLVKEWWQGFGRFSKDAPNPISYKINMFCTTPLISRVINQPENKINIFNILDESKILIADLPKGKLGNEYSRLLGTLIVSLFQVAALKREKISEKSRKDFTIYLDEFESFITPSIISILKEARKFRVNLVLAHQNLAESPLSKEMKGAILGNTGTKIIFRIASKDANLLSDELIKVNSDELVNLDKFQAFVKAFTDIFKINTNPPPEVNQEIARKVIELSRSKYSVPLQKRPSINTEKLVHMSVPYDEI